MGLGEYVEDTDTVVVFSDGREFPDENAYPDGETRYSPTQGEIMWQAIDYLVTEYDLFERIDLPYPPGKREAVVNRKDRHPNGNGFRMPEELSYGNFVETSFNTGQKENHISRLAAECGLEVEFGEWP